VETFQRVTRVEDRALAARHLETAWKAVEYVTSRYADRIHVAVAIPYHPKLIGKEEVRSMGERLAAMKKGLDVNLVVYQPAFRMGHALPPSDNDVSEALELLESTGVTAWCQEGEDIPRPMSPEECVALSDEAW
jgi:pyruvate-formate lyase-activating enzyme